jgi:hypothetical protein
MKTMKLGDTLIRVGDKDAESYRAKGYKYCPKKEWKEKIRDVRKAEIAAERAEKAKETTEKKEYIKKGKKEKTTWNSKN